MFCSLLNHFLSGRLWWMLAVGMGNTWIAPSPFIVYLSLTAYNQFFSLHTNLSTDRLWPKPEVVGSMSKAQSSSNQRWLSLFPYPWRHCWCCYMYRCHSSLGYRRATVANHQWYKPYTLKSCLEFGLDFIINHIIHILQECCPKVVELSSMFGQKSNKLAWESQHIFFKKRARRVR